MLVTLSYKIQVYLAGSTNRQIKLHDIRKIVQLWASLDSLPELQHQFDEFDKSVNEKIAEIEQFKLTSKSKTSTSTTTSTSTSTSTASTLAPTSTTA